VSGQYIGHDAKGTFQAKVTHHKTHESFHLVPCPAGGYLLATQYWNDWLKMAVKGTNLVVAKGEGEGNIWEFVKV